MSDHSHHMSGVSKYSREINTRMKRCDIISLAIPAFYSILNESV